jgi:hypothetical protein
MEKECILLTYHINRLSQKEKMGVLRRIYGYSSKKGGKVYLQRGILEDVGGKRMGINTIMFPSEKLKEIREAFRGFRMEMEMMEVVVR